MEAMSNLEKGFSRAIAGLLARSQRRQGIDMFYQILRKNG
jgi:hypothetical protein